MLVVKSNAYTAKRFHEDGEDDVTDGRIIVVVFGIV